VYRRRRRRPSNQRQKSSAPRGKFYLCMMAVHNSFTFQSPNGTAKGNFYCINFDLKAIFSFKKAHLHCWYYLPHSATAERFLVASNSHMYVGSYTLGTQSKSNDQMPVESQIWTILPLL